MGDCMKKRLSLIMLLVVLGAAKAQADYQVYDNDDDYSSNTLRYTLSQSYDDWPGGADVRFTGSDTDYALEDSNGWLSTLGANHTFIVDNDDDQVTLKWITTSRGDMALISTYTPSGEDTPWLVIPENLDFVAEGEYEVAALYGEDTLILNYPFGSNVDVTANYSDAAGLYAGEDLVIMKSDSGLEQDGGYYGNMTVTAGEDGAFGMLAGDDISIEGDLGGSITVSAGGEDAIGLAAGWYDPSSVIEIGGDVTTTMDISAGEDNAYGMYADEYIDIPGTLGGDYTIEAGAENAYGLATGWGRGVDNSIYLGAVGDIGEDAMVMRVKAGGDNAYGMWSTDDIEINGDLGGTFEIQALDDNAYGLRSGTRGWDTIEIGGDVTADMTVIAGNGTLEAGDDPDTWDLTVAEPGEENNSDRAYGLRSEKMIDIDGELGGTFNIWALDDDAHGLRADDYDIRVGEDLSAKINVTAGYEGSLRSNDNAYGLRAGDDIKIGGGFTGAISATAYGDQAAGMYGEDDIEIGGSLGGSIDVYAGGERAFGIFSGDNTVIGEDFSGNITVEAGGSGAFGIMSLNNIEIGNTFSGIVDVTAGEDGAVGLFAGDDLEMGGNTFTGEIHATAMDDFAVGIFTVGGVYGAGEASDGLNGYGPPYDNEFIIDGGTITASAGADESFAAGILALDGMKLRVSGDALISATAGEDGQANALASGFGPAQDEVTIEDASTLIGNVFLGGGEDMMIVKDQADIEQVARLNGGNGGEDEYDVLTFDGWTGTVGDEIVNWEEINVVNESTVDLGTSKDGEELYAISTLAGEDNLVMFVEEGSTVVSHGTSPSHQTVVGDYVNGGVLDLLDNEENDVFEVTGNYTSDNDTGEIWLDADLATSGVDSSEYLEVGNDVYGQTTVTLNNTVSQVALTEGDGIKFVDVGNDGGDGSFVLGNPDDFGPFAVQIAEGDDDGWYIQSPGYREEAAVLQAVAPFMSQLGYDSVMRFHERRAYGWFRNDSGEHESWWVRATGSKYRLGTEGDAATQLEGYTSWMQVGTDLFANGDKGSRFNLGLFAGAGYATADVDGLRTDESGDISQTAYGVGAYMTLHERGNWYFDAVAQAIYNDLSIDYLTEGKQKPDAWSYIASLETGGCIPLGTGFRLEPQAQLIYQYTEDINLSTLVGDVTIEDHQGLQGRLSLTGVIGDSNASFNPFFEVTAIKDFSEDNSVKYLDGTVELKSHPEEWFLGGAIGLTRAPKTDDGYGYYLKASALYGMDDLDSYSYSVMAGLKKSF